MKESGIEDYLIEQVKLFGGDTRKVTYQGRKGAPDRWCMFPGARLFIVECKKPGKKKADPLQVEEIEFLRSMGFDVRIIDTKQQVDELCLSVLV